MGSALSQLAASTPWRVLRPMTLRLPGGPRWAARSRLGYDSVVPVGYLVQLVFDCARWIPPAWVRRYALRAWVLLAVSLAVLMMLAFFGPAADRSIGVFAVVVGLTGVAMAWGARWSPDLLAVASGTTLARLLSAVALHTLAGYVALIPLAGGLACLVVLLQGDLRHPDAARLVVMMALWFPLFWAPVVGPWWAWRRVLRGDADQRRSPSVSKPLTMNSPSPGSAPRA